MTSESRPIQFGDPKPSPPEDRTAPEVRAAKKGVGRKMKHARVRLARMRQPAPILPARDQVKQLVVVHPGSVRDLVFVEPALRALRLHYQHAERILYADKTARDLFAGSGWGKTEPIERLDNEIGGPNGRVAIDFTHGYDYQLANELQRLNFACRVGFDIAARGSLFTIPIPPVEVDVHYADLYLRIAETLGAPKQGRIPSLPCGFDRIERGRGVWLKNDVQKPVVLLPGWEGAGFGWPPDRFIALGRALAQQEIAVITGRGDELRGHEVAESLGALWVDKPSTTQLLDLLAASSVVIGNDNAALHMAAALAKPVMQFTINPHPWRTWPRSEKPVVVYRAQDSSGHIRFDRVQASDMAAATLYLIGE